MKSKILCFITIIFISIVCFANFQTLYATDELLNPNITITENSNKIDEITNSATKIYNTVAIVVQVVAVIGIIVVGLRYMFASADAKADLKKSLLAVAIGCALAFSAGTVVNFVTSVADETLAVK